MLSFPALYTVCVFCKVYLLYFILSEDDFELKSKIYSFNLHLILNNLTIYCIFPCPVYSDFLLYFLYCRLVVVFELMCSLLYSLGQQCKARGGGKFG
jgi:hypothetical protein